MSPLRTRLLAATAATATALALVPPHTANAEPAPVTGVELNQSIADTIAVDSTFNYAIGETAMPTFRKLRADMWDRNPYYVEYGAAPRSTRLQDVARKYGVTTKEQFVNKVSYDPGLSIIGVQRSAEQYPLDKTKLSHDRPVRGNCVSPTGLACSDSRTASLNGVGAIENLAWGSGTQWTIQDFVNAWGYGEYDGLVQAGGQAYGGGHLWQMLNPVWEYMGFGLINVQVGGQWHTLAANPMSTRPTGVTSVPAGIQRTNLYRVARDFETPTGLRPNNAKPKPSPGTGGTSGTDAAGGSSSASDVKAIIGIIAAVVTLLGALAGVAQQFMR